MATARSAAFRRLTGTPARAVAIPDLAGERCVHARIETARCRACVEACPRGAWIIDDERVGIDTEACDGCDVCVPACPEGAIISARPRDAEIRSWRGRPAVFRACERAGVSAEAGVIPCVHSIGLTDLLRLYRRGVRDWIVSAAPCESCPLGTAPRFQEAIHQAQTLLSSRELPPLTLTVLEPQRWSATANQAAPYLEDAAVNRRGFFRKALRVAVDTAMETAGAPDTRAPFAPAATWLPETGPNAVQLYQPAIDPQRCNGCDACARLCPHQAIALERLPTALQYRLDGQRCTGCGICQDACDQNAASVIALRPQQTRAVPLLERRCPACGTPYHQPAAHPSSAEFCRICTRTRRTRLLFQTLD